MVPRAEVVARSLALVVPALADACVLSEHGVVAGVRVDAPDADRLEAAIRAQPPASPPPAAILVEAEDAGLPEALDVAWAVHAPLRVHGRVTGSLTLALGPSGRRFATGDVRFIGVLAGRLAVALDGVALLRAERQLEALVAGMDDAVAVRDAQGWIVFANQAAVELLGAPSLEKLRDMSLDELWSRFALYDPDGRPLREADLPWRRVLDGEPKPPPILMRQVDRDTGGQRWLLSKASSVPGPDGGTAMVMSVNEDVTAAKRAELGQRLLVDAGRLLSRTLDLEPTLQEIAELVVPPLADWCAIDLPGEHGTLDQVAVAHVESGKVEVARRLRALHPVDLDGDSPLVGVLRTGEPVRMDNISPAAMRAAAVDAEHFAMLESLGLSALLAVPLRSGDDVLGVLSLVASQPHRRFDDADQEVAAALARRVGDALRNARLYRDRAEIAQVLFAGLRPDAAPAAPGCEIAAVYEPAGEGVDAGGDFYDVIDAPAGSIVVMGDVVGKGAPAAALSAVARVTLRTAGRLTGDPHAALNELNHALRRRGGMSLCTVVAVALPSELPGSAEVLLAGHPPPLLVRDGVAQPLGEHGPLLGAVEVAAWPPATVELAPNDVLVLYTDGVLDAMLPSGERFGEARLARLAAAWGDDVGALAAGVMAELGGLRRRDDIALLAIRCPGPPALLARGTIGSEAEPVLALALSGGPTAPRAARRALAEALAGRVSERIEGDALLIVSELVTNAIRHGGAPGADDELTLHAALVPQGLRLEVCDPGPGFEPGGHGPRPDGGYGLHLLDRLASRWGVAGAEPVTVWVELDR
jgi:PAS domain S-box-containing protein